MPRPKNVTQEADLNYFACKVDGKWHLTGKHEDWIEAFKKKFKRRPMFRKGEQIRVLGGRLEIARDIIEFLRNGGLDDKSTS